MTNLTRDNRLPALLRQPVPVALYDATLPAFIIPASMDEAEGIAALAALLATDDLALFALCVADGPYRDMLVETVERERARRSIG